MQKCHQSLQSYQPGVPESELLLEKAAPSPKCPGQTAWQVLTPDSEFISLSTLPSCGFHPQCDNEVFHVKQV